MLPPRKIPKIPLLIAGAALLLARNVTVPRARAAGDEPGALRLEPLLVAPRGAPRCQLLRLSFADKAPPPGFEVQVHAGVRPPERSRCEGSYPGGGFAVTVPPLDGETEVRVTARGEEWSREASAVLRPLRPWKLFLVQHTHTDIGYTALPSRLNVDHLVFLDEALRACRLTDDYPDDARFRWTCEGTWAVCRYLERRPPEAVEEFLRRVREGRIEVTALRMNMTDLASEELVVRNLLPVAYLRRHGISVRTSMQCDVNGYPWALPELLGEIGVTGFAGGINHTRSTLPFDFPRAIAWESPSGGRVVAWRGEHYMFANMVGFRDSVEKVLERLPAYLASLEKRGYPYRVALLQMAGYFTDNAAPCHRASDLVRQWNEQFAVPQVRLATLSEWFEALGREEEPPATRKAWPDWWADGVGSAPLETAIVRWAQEKLWFAEAFYSLARAVRPDLPDRRGAFEEAYLLACLYDEHTFGAAESISRPLSENTKTQWKEKASYAHRARWKADELEDAALALWAPRAVPRGKTAIVVFNALSWKRTGPALVEVPRGVADDGMPFRLADPQTGEEVPYQFAGGARNYREIEIFARDVPPLGWRVYLLEPGEPAAADSPFQVAERSLANGLTRVVLDPERAGIREIHTPPAGPNAVDPGREHACNQYVHEQIVNDKGRWHLWPPAARYAPEAFTRLGARDAEVLQGVSGPVRASLRLGAKVLAPTGEISVETEVSLYRELPWVVIHNRVESPGTTEPVAGYFAFPCRGGPPEADVAGGVMVPGRDQIPGSAADWHALQRWVRVPAPGGAVAWVTRDAPLIQFGGFNTGRWTEGLSLEEPLFYSWVTNNYWFTNFVASQRGEFSFRYALSAGPEAVSPDAAHRFARSVCLPLRGVVVDGTGAASEPPRASLVEIGPESADLVGLKEAEEAPRALALRLRNRSAGPSRVRVRFAPLFAVRSVAEADVLEEPQRELELRDGVVVTEVPAWGLRTLLVRF